MNSVTQALKAINWALHMIDTQGVKADPKIVEQLRIALKALENS
jgi:hypothetical protein